MVTSKATTIDEYLKSLPAERREVIKTVRHVIKNNLPAGYREHMSWGMITYDIPLETYRDTYNGQPLMFAGLAAQKNHYGLYLVCVYGSAELRAKLAAEFKKSGLKLNMGKACIRFQKAEDLPLPAIGRMIKSISVKKYIACYEKARAGTGKCD
jgi:uncharacterized protein YdhG (YjbR/CyaY superfamily)